MHGKYGEFSITQIEEYKKKLHSKIHWLLIYKESGDDESINTYFENLMRYVSSLNIVFDDNPLIIELLTNLQMAFDENTKSNCNFKIYRKYILDSHNIIDKL